MLSDDNRCSLCLLVLLSEAVVGDLDMLEARYLELAILVLSSRRLAHELLIAVRLIVVLLALLIRALGQVKLEANRRILLLRIVLALRLGMFHEEAMRRLEALKVMRLLCCALIVQAREVIAVLLAQLFIGLLDLLAEVSSALVQDVVLSLVVPIALQIVLKVFVKAGCMLIVVFVIRVALCHLIRVVRAFLAVEVPLLATQLIFFLFLLV